MSARLNEIISHTDEYSRELPVAPHPQTMPDSVALAGQIDHTLLKEAGVA